MGKEIFVEQIGSEEGRIVGVERDHQAFFVVAADGMVWNFRVTGECGTTAGAEVAGDVQLQRDLALGEDFDQVGVLLCGECMADALGTDVQGCPDALRTGGFAGVTGEVQASGLGFGEELAEFVRWAAGFIAADANADDTGVLVLEFGGLGEDAGTFLQAEVADGVDDPEQREAEVALAALAAALDGGHHRVDVEAREVVEDADGDVGLGVANALRSEVAEHVVGDGLVVGGGVQALGDGLEAHEEAGEVGVGVDLACGFEVERVGVVAEGEFDQRLGCDGALEVQVELGLGKAAKPDFGVGWKGGLDSPGAGHRSSVVNCVAGGGEVAAGTMGDGGSMMSLRRPAVRKVDMNNLVPCGGYPG